MRDLLKENNYQDLYHFTDIGALFFILETNSLKTDNNRISLTRNKNFDKHSTEFNDMDCRITVDANKLKNKYKLKPYDWAGDPEFKNDPWFNGKLEDQSEEVIEGSVNNFSQYIKQINIKRKALTKILKGTSSRIDLKRIKKILNLPLSSKISEKDVIKYFGSFAFEVNII